MTLAVCIPNIGPRQRRRRLLVVGVAMLTIAAVLAVALVASTVPRSREMMMSSGSIVGAVDCCRSRAKTCVALTARGLRNIDAGDVPITEDAELRIVEARRDGSIFAVLFSSWSRSSSWCWVGE